LKNKYWPLHEPNKTKAFVKTIKDERRPFVSFFSRRWAFRNDSFVLSQKSCQRSSKKVPQQPEMWRSLLRHCFDALNKVVVVGGIFIFIFFFAIYLMMI
jgi:hypothetical protein